MNNINFSESLHINSLLPFEVLDLYRQNNNFISGTSKVKYLEMLKHNICKSSSESAYQKYCTLNKLTDDELLIMTSKINYCEKTDNSYWIKTLEEILSQDLNNSEYGHGNKIMFSALLAPFVKYFEKKIRIAFNLLSDKIIEDLKIDLYKDLVQMSFRVFLIEFEKFKKNKKHLYLGAESNKCYKLFVEEILLDKFNNLFYLYPMLSRKITKKIINFTQFIIKILSRLNADKLEISQVFKVDIVNISKLHLNSGDQHNGESTSIIEFEDNYKIVYKPINVKITKSYNLFLDWINNELNVNLKSFKVVDKQNYGWLEFVENTECQNFEDVKKYYNLAGILVGITYFLNSTDYHFENIVATNECPILIDHETLLGPKLKEIPKSTVENNSLIGTVLESLLLPSKGEHGFKCGLGSLSMISKSSTSIRVINCNKDNMTLVPTLISFNSKKKNIPRLAGNCQYLNSYKNEVIDGFKSLYKLILNNKSLLISIDSPLSSFYNIEIRFLLRNTFVYGKILNILNKPELLKDSKEYGLKLEVLARAYLNNNNIEYFPFLKSERDQMINDDIPVFYTTTSSKFLKMSNGTMIDFFENSAMENVMRKINEADDNDYNIQINLIKEAFTL